jgi:carboxymethylenebutenolidase
VRPGKIGVTGYCMGGGLALKTAEHFPERIAVAASFHAGRLATDAPTSPHLLLNQVKARLYFGHADADESMPAEQIKRLETALAAAKLRYESEIYSGAVHGFTMADLPAYNEAAFNRHWEKLAELLSAELL